MRAKGGVHQLGQRRWEGQFDSSSCMCGESNRELLYEYARSKGIDPVLEGWV